ncbi:hypothetical protein CH379_002615 [Leptospira ellisii]|uniref:Phospholipase n=1 Tax=Leptospira ellisii TaxID=2023197 RepID=A0AAE4TRG6_9LEPT|nr:hypothetical protein [Leptospira ellisii]MDV6234518.1 hypothetical protein [Leptospira ellisii]
MGLTYFFLLAGLFFLPSAVFSWGTHYLVMDRSLDHSSMGYVSAEVPSESLESFVVKEKHGLKTLFDDFAKWEEERKSKRFRKIEFRPEQASVLEFLRAARLNPKTNFSEVERILPGSDLRSGTVPAIEISPYLFDTPELPARFRSSKGKKVKIRSILRTFVDEPDWGMDHGLWGFEEYGYGKQAYGKPEGEGSKAPFHMQFQNESWILRLFAPEVVEGGMILDRIELFSRLSELAKKTGHPYWRARFASWAAHYIQDIGQPYHSKAVPDAGILYYIDYVFSSKETKKEKKARATQLVANRHFLYEDFVSFGLIQSYVQPDDINRSLVGFLATEFDSFPANAPVRDLVSFVGENASSHAFEINRSIVSTFAPEYTMNPAYDLEKELGTKMKEIFPTLDPEKSKSLLQETGRDFALTGSATRSILNSLLKD